jgi:hypothetical protein
MMPIEPGALISVTLSASDWNAVLAILSEAPFRAVAGIITQITDQATAATTAPMTNGPTLVDGITR